MKQKYVLNNPLVRIYRTSWWLLAGQLPVIVIGPICPDQSLPHKNILELERSNRLD